MVDTQLAGGAWITLPAGSWQRLNDESICSRFHSRGLSQSVNYTLRLRSFRDIQSHSNSAHVRLADADRYKFERMPMSLADMSNSRFRVMAVDVCRLMKRHETSYSAASAPTKKKRKPTSQSATATAMVAVEYKLVAISSVLYEGSDVVGGRHTLACRKFFDEEEEDEGVQLFDTEIEVVERWLQLMRSFDPDILEGYELSTHWSWLCTKLASISRYPLDLGRIYNDAHSSAGSSSIKRTKLPRTRQRVASKLLRQGGGRQSADSAIADAIDSGTDSNGGGDSLSRPRISAPSNRAFQVVECIGRILLDIRQVMEHEELMSTYGFGEIVRRFLHRETEILDDENLERLLAGQMVDIDGGHQRAVQYWQTRCERVFAVVEESKVLLSLIELARITGINISDVMLRGQMVRFQSQLLQFCRKASYLLPSPTRQTVAGNFRLCLTYHFKFR
jgi:DNA polymerase elongation subunit (family B)